MQTSSWSIVQHWYYCLPLQTSMLAYTSTVGGRIPRSLSKYSDSTLLVFITCNKKKLLSMADAGHAIVYYQYLTLASTVTPLGADWDGCGCMTKRVLTNNAIHKDILAVCVCVCLSALAVCWTSFYTSGLEAIH